MARVPGAGPVTSRLHGALTPAEATALYRCFLLDRLDALAAVPGIARVVVFTPPEARAEMTALAPPGCRPSPPGRRSPPRSMAVFASTTGESPRPAPHTAGRRWAHGCACSKAAAARSTPASSRQRPAICSPTGRPSRVNPAGTEMAGALTTVKA